MKIDKKSVKDLLPHREPMLLVDEAELEDGVACAKLFVDPRWEIFKGHFPGKPVLPGIYLVEAMAQAADLILMSMEENRGKLPYFSAINKMRFIRPVEPGAELTLKAQISTDAGNGFYDCTVSAYIEDRKAAQGSLSLAVR